MQNHLTLAQMLESASESAMKKKLGSLKPKQREVLESLACRKNTFAALPTGYGKSLCAWMPAAAWGWKVWVISPLVSLIADQALACETFGLDVIAWRGGLPREERRRLEVKMASGRWQICFLSPERLVHWFQSGFFADAREFGFDPDLLVLDEMHCLEEWRAFRSSYQSLNSPMQDLLVGGSLFLGLSASLSISESKAWMQEICGTYTQVLAPLGRENLFLGVLPMEHEHERWLFLVSCLRELEFPKSALVYCATREEADETSRWLRSMGMDAVAFHAGLSGAERNSRVWAFRTGLLRIVCATSAFGMGIDYPHVDRVIHFSMPRDLESYWQEVGRAGRSGERAEGIAFWRRSEIVRARLGKASEGARFLALWDAWSRRDCRKMEIAKKLGLVQEPCGNCDACGGQSRILEASSQAWWTKFPKDLREWLRFSHIIPDEVKRSVGFLR